MSIDWSIQGHPQAHSTSTRRSLTSGWQICATAPKQFAQPADLPADLIWMDAPRLGPAADVLRQLGQWSLDGEARRFDAQDWWYRLRFDHEAAAAALPASAILGLDGLATVAEVWLNGAPILSSANMFLAHQLDVASHLKPGSNELLIAFRSLDQDLTARRPRPRWRAPMIENQQLRWLRTTVLGRTPGWSPPCQVVGPWRDVWLETDASVRLGAVSLRSGLQGDAGLLSFEAGVVLVDSAGVLDARLRLSLKGQPNEQHEAVVTVSADGRLSASLSVPKVQKWWPHTHGQPHLYEAQLLLTLQGQAEPAAFDLGHVGFRSAEVDRSNGDFAVRVNGVPVFCRGACWTPLDPVTLRADTAAYRTAIEQMAEAGMNMVRVGGTMVYEADAFYDACDELGVMVWQEFMFANMDYPQDAAFVDAVKQEAEQQLRRWQARPSMAVLCGNSEVEQQAAMWGATRDKWAPELFHQTLSELAGHWCPDVTYWPSSAHGGAFPHQGDTGTTSYYGVGAYLRPQDDARRANVRFATECLAFANMPEMAAMQAMPGGLGLRVHHPQWKTRAPRDLGAGWDFEDVRDHYMAQLFDVDPTRLRYSDHDRYVLLSRVTSGEIMSATFQDWRRPASSCRGALVWFMRDLWPGAGWGVVDSLGQPKAAYYYLKRTLQPFFVGLTDEGGNGLYAHLINETQQPQSLSLQVTAYRSGGVQVGQGAIPVELGAGSAQTLPVAACFDWFTDLNWAYRFGPATAQVVVASLVGADGKVVSQAWHFPQGLGLPREADVGLQASATVQPDGHWALSVSTRSFAQSVQLDVDGLVPDDAYFHLAPGQTKVIRLRPVSSPGHPIGDTGKPLAGSVKALNSEASANIQIVPPIPAVPTEST